MKAIKDCPCCNNKMLETDEGNGKYVLHSCFKSVDHIISIISDVETKDVILYGLIIDIKHRTKCVFNLQDKKLYSQEWFFSSILNGEGGWLNPTVDHFLQFPYFEIENLSYNEIVENLKDYWEKENKNPRNQRLEYENKKAKSHEQNLV